MAISRLDLARAFYRSIGQDAPSSARPLTSTVYGVATEDSVGGIVRVNLGGSTVSGDCMQSVPVSTSSDVRAGDRVLVSLFGDAGTARTPIVTGVIGGGDRTREEMAAKLDESFPQYVQTTSPTAVPGDDAGWSESSPTWIDGMYIWFRMATTKNGATTYTEPTCITGARGQQGIKGDAGADGVPGKDGKDGKDGTDGTSTYVHIKYAPVESPSDSQMTEEPADYIGWCTDSSPSDPTTASSYTWSRFRGEDGAQGLPGPAGADGRTTYVHFAYSTSADGKANFSVKPFAAATYLGTRTDFVEADSTVYTDYAWSLIKGAKGDQGSPGKDGTSYYIHIKYSAVASPTDAQMTDTPSDYIGWCTTTSPADPTTASSYTWSRFKGEDGPQGLPGAAGADGRTSYVHFAYATSADGKSNFSTSTFQGATYLGVRTDFAALDSATPSDYQWSLIKGSKGDPGAAGKDGQDGSDGQMLVASSATAASTAAKVATLQSGTIALAAGVCVSVVFSATNTAASPTLSVRSADGSSATTPKPIMTCGTPAAYWQAGSAVTFAYDGKYWQVCSAPVYGSTATIGNPVGNHVVIDSDGVRIYTDGKLIASFIQAILTLGFASGAHVVLDQDGLTVYDSASGQSLKLAKGSVAFGASSDTIMQVAFGVAKVLSTYTASTTGAITQVSITAADTASDVGSATVAMQPVGAVDSGISVTYGPDGTSDTSKSTTTTIKTDRISYNGWTYDGGAVSQSLPVVLFDNDSQALSGAITLSEAAANFERMTICYRSDNGFYGSTEVWHPDGKQVALTETCPDESGWVTAKGKIVLISGKTIDTVKGSSRYLTGQGYVHSSPGFDFGDYLAITQVIGYRKDAS